jgi:hypothetical protein
LRRRHRRPRTPRSRYPAVNEPAIPCAVASFIFSVSKSVSIRLKSARKFALAFRKLLDGIMAYNSYGLFGDSDTISSQEILNVSGFLRLR